MRLGAAEPGWLVPRAVGRHHRSPSRGQAAGGSRVAGAAPVRAAASGVAGARSKRQGAFLHLLPALGLVSCLRKMVSTSMARCACRCYDNECIVKTNTSRLHIADKPTPNESPATCGYWVMGALSAGLGWHRSAEPSGRPCRCGEPFLVLRVVSMAGGAGVTWTSCSPAAPCH